jgi:cell division protein FtsW
MQTKDGCDRRAMQYILWVCLAIIPLIMMENLSTAALLCLVIFMMMFIGRVPGAQLGKLAGLVVILCVSIVTCVMVLGQDNSKELAANHLTEQTAKKAEQEESSGIFHRFDTWKSRIMKFSDGTEIPPEKVDLDKDAQTSYANVAIASSNIIGKGPGNSVARDFLSQAFSDFIYAIIIEEMGLVGAFFVAMLYIILLFRTGRIANRCERSFSAFLAMGLALLLVTQALFNMCVAVGLAPVTGQPLPLISKGGTSTIINCVYIGMILSISKSAKKNALSVEETSKATAVAA